MQVSNSLHGGEEGAGKGERGRGEGGGGKEGVAHKAHIVQTSKASIVPAAAEEGTMQLGLTGHGWLGNLLSAGRQRSRVRSN